MVVKYASTSLRYISYSESVDGIPSELDTTSKCTFLLYWR